MKLINITLLMLTLCQIVSCQEIKDSFNLAKDVLEINNINCLYEKSKIPSRYQDPNSIIVDYTKWVFGRAENSILTRGVRDIITLEELNKMKMQYSAAEWKEIHWPSNNQVNLISNFSECQHKKALSISEPLFTSDKKKAISYQSIETCSGTSFSIIVLTKENNNWIIAGSVPIGIGDKISNSDCKTKA